MGRASSPEWELRYQGLNREQEGPDLDQCRSPGTEGPQNAPSVGKGEKWLSCPSGRTVFRGKCDPWEGYRVRELEEAGKAGLIRLWVLSPLGPRPERHQH